YTGLPHVPPEILRNGPFLRSKDGMVNAITVYTSHEGAAADLLTKIRKRYQGFAAIPDFHYDIQEWREFRELLAGWVE
ncbi:MAG TPA: hypothetical protein VLA15_08125, partial [Desulfurivibrionaceae bacterium]|nr:hypothetical protein [Desulfurivibrionaceae bacterium]